MGDKIAFQQSILCWTFRNRMHDVDSAERKKARIGCKSYKLTCCSFHKFESKQVSQRTSEIGHALPLLPLTFLYSYNQFHIGLVLLNNPYFRDYKLNFSLERIH